MDERLLQVLDVKTEIEDREKLDSALHDYLYERIWCDKYLMQHNIIPEINQTIQIVVEKYSDEIHQRAFEMIKENIVFDENAECE